MSEKLRSMPAEPLGLAHIREAARRLASRGRPVTARNVRAELISWRGVGGSLKHIVAELQRWRADTLAKASGRIESAADAVLTLATDLERDALRRMVEQRSGGGITIRFVVKARNTGGGWAKAAKRPRHTRS
jgi:hypothetical protein